MLPVDAASKLSPLPVTKVPALDVVDRYVVGRSPAAHGCSETIEMQCRSEDDLATGFIQGYADFIIQFTGLEEVAFVVDRGLVSGVQPRTSQTVIHATQSASRDSFAGNGTALCSWREVDFPAYRKEDIQFVLDMNSTASCNGTSEHEYEFGDVSRECSILQTEY